MAKTLFEILRLSWERQADHLHGLSLRELQVLLHQLHRMAVEEKDKEAFDKFVLAVISVIRDYNESR